MGWSSDYTEHIACDDVKSLYGKRHRRCQTILPQSGERSEKRINSGKFDAKYRIQE